ncbi:MAG: hypothetical protein JWM82_4432, partial [Myxococcales bacterium]|nr:hypothetical protein [Myxococcales bacterium]
MNVSKVLDGEPRPVERDAKLGARVEVEAAHEPDARAERGR